MAAITFRMYICTVFQYFNKYYSSAAVRDSVAEMGIAVNVNAYALYEMLAARINTFLLEIIQGHQICVHNIKKYIQGKIISKFTVPFSIPSQALVSQKP